MCVWIFFHHVNRLLCLWTVVSSVLYPSSYFSSFSGKDRDRWRSRERGGGFKIPSRRTASSNHPPPSVSPSPPPPRPPPRSRRKSKSPSSRSTHATPNRALDVDKIGTNSDPEETKPKRRGFREPRGSQGLALDRKWEGVALELRQRSSRMRAAVYQTSDLPSMVKAKKQLKQSQDKGQTNQSKLKATFVWGGSRGGEAGGESLAQSLTQHPACWCVSDHTEGLCSSWNTVSRLKAETNICVNSRAAAPWLPADHWYWQTGINHMVRPSSRLQTHSWCEHCSGTSTLVNGPLLS